MEEHFREVATERVPVRLALTLIRLHKQIGRPSEEGTVLAVSQDELAQMIGTTLFTVSRILGQWQVRGLLTTRREAVVIANAAGLRSLTEPAARSASL
jgi:CRP-like cAMP-binding protein